MVTAEARDRSTVSDGPLEGICFSLRVIEALGRVGTCWLCSSRCSVTVWLRTHLWDTGVMHGIVSLHQFMGGSPAPGHDGVWGSALGRWLGLDEVMRAVFPCWDYCPCWDRKRERKAVRAQEEGSSLGTKTVGVLIFSVSRAGRNGCSLIRLPRLLYCVIAKTLQVRKR